MHITDTSTNKKRIEAENRVRKLVNSIPDDHIPDFINVMEQNLKNSGSLLSVYDILNEEKNDSISV